ncbi:Cyclic di-GMP phosphodiesterase response regulator RpfG [Marinobacter litoralis]|uniref:Cyclic di-GMP phosphodiesterase response regulator RpfG n=1 Tax=Marinobacter litoralis TaxID=187981 RepID=A0A3M2RA01_9GAMM|nr:HD-GYP domain-containing protein [Marinobacter litoralis]RMJ02029.1 Cyclic di-GMP phosphodiesterase response regulator RpfG [Marinobacter litoralis]
MGVQQRKLAVHDLEIGMFVSDLDRPWHQTPFPIQGFYIRSQNDVRALVSHCKWVMVDEPETRESVTVDAQPVAGFRVRAKQRANGREEVQLPPLSIREPVRHKVSTTLKKEIKTSKRLLGDAEVALERLFNSVRSEAGLDARLVADVTGKMVKSVCRQPSALLWLSRTRQYDDFVYRHALNTSVWALVVGRQLGLNEGLLNHLGAGCLLSQVGKTTLPAEIVQQEQHLSVEDFEIFRTYVQRGVEILKPSGVSKAVLSVVQGHRERHNGSGFPCGVGGERIPLLAKVAGIAEFFESLIAPREGQEPMTPAKAVGLLYEMRNIEFQKDLVEAFIQAVGVYPAGTLVELSNGCRGVVVSHSPERRLWPSVMIMQSSEQSSFKSGKVVDLARYNESQTEGAALAVRECLPHGTDGLDLMALDATNEPRWSLGKLFTR